MPEESIMTFANVSNQSASMTLAHLKYFKM